MPVIIFFPVYYFSVWSFSLQVGTNRFGQYGTWDSLSLFTLYFCDLTVRVEISLHSVFKTDFISLTV